MSEDKRKAQAAEGRAALKAMRRRGTLQQDRLLDALEDVRQALQKILDDRKGGQP